MYAGTLWDDNTDRMCTAARRVRWNLRVAGSLCMLGAVQAFLVGLVVIRWVCALADEKRPYFPRAAHWTRCACVILFFAVLTQPALHAMVYTLLRDAGGEWAAVAPCFDFDELAAVDHLTSVGDEQTEVHGGVALVRDLERVALVVLVAASCIAVVVLVLLVGAWASKAERPAKKSVDGAQCVQLNGGEVQPSDADIENGL